MWHRSLRMLLLSTTKTPALSFNTRSKKTFRGNLIDGNVFINLEFDQKSKENPCRKEAHLNLHTHFRTFGGWQVKVSLYEKEQVNREGNKMNSIDNKIWTQVHYWDKKCLFSPKGMPPTTSLGWLIWLQTPKLFNLFKISPKACLTFATSIQWLNGKDGDKCNAFLWPARGTMQEMDFSGFFRGSSNLPVGGFGGFVRAIKIKSLFASNEY